MCGIIGGTKFIDSELYRKMMEEEGFLNRGEHSFGLFAINFKERKYYCIKDINGGDFLSKLDEAKEIVKDCDYFVYHNRWASIGGSSDLTLAHPIYTESAVVLHNGTNSSYKIFDAKSDTEGMALYGAGIQEVFKNQDETGVIFFFDIKAGVLKFYKDKSRSLFINSDGYFASEPMKLLGEDWKSVGNTEGLINIEDMVTNVKEYKASRKDINSGSCSKCSKRSSNGEKITEYSISKFVCYSCLTKEDK